MPTEKENGTNEVNKPNSFSVEKEKEEHAEQINYLKSLITVHENWPKPGVTFSNILPIFYSPSATEILCDLLIQKIRKTFTFDDDNFCFVGLEARGFVIGSMLAVKMGRPFVPVRKAGKLPGSVYSVEYEKEYGMDRFELSADSKTVISSQKVIIVDDLLATGGSANAAIQLVQKAGGKVEMLLVVAEIPSLLKEKIDCCPIESIFKF